MNLNDVLRIAREAGLYSDAPRTPGTGAIVERKLERFAALVETAVRADEREECARVVERCTLRYEAAIAIRARGNS